MKRLALLPFAVLLLAAGDPRTETEHVVTEGETLGGIANRAGVSLGVIAVANGLSEPYRVRLGQKLIIPRQRNHVVKSGETGFGIAYQYGVPFSQIAIANQLPADGTVRAGQRLIIPAVLPERAASTTASTPSRPYFRRPHDGAVLLGWRRRADGGGHEGIDYAVNPGDMIRAAGTGTVLFAGDEPTRFGKLVIIDHGNGWTSSYGHLTRVTVKAGDAIKTGERIGIGGQGGTATRPELHFEIRRNETPVDPAPLLGQTGGN
ncbi:peptidoglycan DD-metalloendopeptidase family protein [Altererythrobacter xixiisoli]|uniref:Peptidoglycan DD-metalloendopeptidase family protein n=1 Tax=Croceibacterium xixiisoli TaxID=1476466 RepID=A0A6I4TQ48_9SPHN|nr:M23 family metallopeptidase [Croceibacterium xixiisoli]MXO98072.1 peptidoglycan DD-metalloendopeptidase family protein [Croceibacterium xixiisoli]